MRAVLNKADLLWETGRIRALLQSFWPITTEFNNQTITIGFVQPGGKPGQQRKIKDAVALWAAVVNL